MNAIAISCRQASARTSPILARSIASLLVPVGLALAAVISVPSARASDTVTFSAGTLKDTLGAASDSTTVSTDASGSSINVSGTGFGGTVFSNVTSIDAIFSAASQTATFDTTNFSFTPAVTIGAGAGAASDEVIIEGNNAHTITFTGTSTYGGGTALEDGQLVVKSSGALGTGAVTLGDGTELRGSGTVTLNNTVNFSATTSATLSAAAGGTLTLNDLDVNGALTGLNFGSSGNTGAVVIGPGAPGGYSSLTTLTVAFGTLKDGGGLGALFSSTNLTTTVNAGATLSLNDNKDTVGNLVGAGNVTLGTKSSTVLTLDSTSLGFGGVISGAGQLDVSGFTFLTGASTYTGGTTIAAGQILQLGNETATGSIMGNVSIASNGSLDFARSNAYTFSGIISGAGAVGQLGAGVLTLSGQNTYSGGTDINSGVLVVTKSSAVGTGPVTLSDSTELRASGTVTLNNTVNFASSTTTATLSAAQGGTLTLNNLDTTNTTNHTGLTFGSSGNTGTVAIGSTVTAGANRITLIVAFGTLRNAGGLSALTHGGTDPTTLVNNGATLSLNDLPTTIDILGGSGSVTLGSKSTTILTLDNDTAFGGVISGAGQVNVTFPVVFTGNNTYTGGTTIAANDSLQLGAGRIATTGSIVGNVSIASGGLLEFGRSNAYTFGGIISGLGSVEQNGAGVLTLSGKNTYSGGTKLNAGVLAFTNASALGVGPVTLSDGAELRGSGTVALNNTVSFATGTTSATLSATTGGTFTLNNLDTTDTTGLTFGSAGNTGAVVIAGSVTNPNKTEVTVAFGTLKNGGSLGALTGPGTTIVDAGAALNLSDVSTTVNFLAGAGNVTLGSKPTTVLTLDSASFGGAISGSGQVNSTGTAGTVTFTGANTYTGLTTVASGVLQLGSFDTTGSIVGNVSLATAGSNLSFARNNADTFGGIISGAGAVGQLGTGVLTLSGNNTYSGGTEINSGVLVAGNSHALGTGAVTLSNGAELRGSGTVTLGNAVNFLTGTTNATLSATTSGTFTVTNLDNSNTAALTIGSSGNTGTVVIGSTVTAGTNLTSLTVAFGTLKNGAGLDTLTDASGVTTTVNAGATLSLNDLPTTVSTLEGAGNVTLGTKSSTVLSLESANFGGVISGAGQVNVSGSGLVTGNNTYTGGTTIDASSTLKIALGATGSIAGNVSVGLGGELDFARTNAYTFGGIISGTGFVDGGEGGSVLTLTGNSTYSGGTKIEGGVVVVGNNHALGTGAVTLSDGAELRGSGTITLGNTVNFASSTTTATLSAAPGGTLTVNNLDTTNTTSLTFGTAGHTGAVVIGPTVTAGTNLGTVTVAFGTLENGGGLDALTSIVAGTTVDAGATLSLNDHSTTVEGLAGSGFVTLGSKSATILSLGLTTFDGVISGAGQLDAISPVTLTGANTYTGGTTIAASQSLQLGNGGTTGSIAGNVSLSATTSILAFDRSNAYTFAGGISGNGGVQQNGAGVLTLSGQNTYSGGTKLNAGVLAFTTASALGTGPVTLSDGTELRGSGAITLANPLSYSGTSSATISTSGTLTLPDLTLSGGRLIFGSSGHAGTVSIPSSETSSASGNFRLEVAFGTLSNAGGLNTFTSSAIFTQVDQGATLSLNDFNTTTDLTGAGTVKTGTKSSTVLTLASTFFQGTISGAGQVNTTGGGSGVVEFESANTYTGGTTASAVKWVANNPSGSATGTGPVTIDSGATIGGKGTVSGAMTLDSGGTVKPGVNESGEPGTKFHGSSLLWEGGSTLDFQIGSTADELLLTGALTKGIGTGFNIDIENDTIVTGNYTLATFASTTFSLSDFTLDLPNGVSAILVENTKSLVLDITQAELPAHGEETSTPADSGLSDGSVADTTSSSSFTSSEPLQPTPEPASTLLLAFGGAALLGWRRQRNV